MIQRNYLFCSHVLLFFTHKQFAFAGSLEGVVGRRKMVLKGFLWSAASKEAGRRIKQQKSNLIFMFILSIHKQS